MDFRRTFALLFVCAGMGLAGAGALAASGAESGAASGVSGGAQTAWTIEPTPAPRYAAIEPASTNLDIDTVLLVCEQGSDGPFLQLQLYQTEEGFLSPTYDHSAPTKEVPRADITIDGQHFAATLQLGENYAVLGDDRDGDSPKLSDRLVRTLESGKTMKLRIDLLAETSGPPAFDTEAVIDLQRPGKAQAIAAMRRCAERSRVSMR